MPHNRKNYHFRELPSHMYGEHELPPDFEDFAALCVLPHIKVAGYKQDEKRRIATHIAHNLITTGLAGATVADTRDKNSAGTRLRTQVWDAVVAAGLAQVCLGSEQSGHRTRYRATGKLLQIRELWESRLLCDIKLHRNSQAAVPTRQALVVLHTGTTCRYTGLPLPDEEQGKPVPLTGDENAALAKEIELMENDVERINHSNLQHSWLAYHTDPETGRRYSFQPNICLRQIHVGELHRACRYYSWGPLSAQNLPRAVRQEMLIDGEATAEFDYAGMATRMLYKGGAPRGDVYRPKQIMPKFHGFANATDEGKAAVRDLVKLATNICWNVETRQAANSTVAAYLADHPQGKFLRRVLYDVEGSNPTDLIGRIMAAHPKLKRYFFSGIGPTLMTSDSWIMRRILLTFADAGKPALGLHDSVVCRVSDAKFTKRTMLDAYFYVKRHDPVIKRVY